SSDLACSRLVVDHWPDGEPPWNCPFEHWAKHQADLRAPGCNRMEYGRVDLGEVDSQLKCHQALKSVHHLDYLRSCLPDYPKNDRRGWMDFPWQENLRTGQS